MLASNTLTAAPPPEMPPPFPLYPLPSPFTSLPSYLKEVSILQSQSISNSILYPLPFPFPFISSLLHFIPSPFLSPSLHSQRVSNLLSQSPNHKAVTVFCNLLPYFVMYTLSECEMFPKFPTPLTPPPNLPF